MADIMSAIFLPVFFNMKDMTLGLVLDQLTSVSKTALFALLVLVTVLITYIGQEVLIPDRLYYEFYSSQLSIDRIDKIIELKDKWSWISYVILPFVYLIKFSVIAIWILVCMVFQGYKTSFRKLMSVVILSEFVFIIPPMMRLIWFGLIQTDFSLSEFQLFNPLSLANFFDVGELELWWRYPLQSFNLFELIYTAVLSIGLSIVFKIKLMESMQFMFPTYFLGLLIWIVFVSFLTLNIS